MPFGFVLQDETGRTIERLGDQDGSVSRAILNSRGSSLLSAVDPYGDTVFNHIQARILLRDWGLVEGATASEGGRQVCADVRQLIERVARGPHLYLRFVGD